MNKKSIYIGIAVLVIILIAGSAFFYYQNQPSQIQSENQVQHQSIVNQQTTTQITTQSEVQTSTQGEEKFYTMTQVAQHNSKESCWTVIRGRVYDLTQWIDKHPGGPDKILALCGKDGTQAFEDKHGGQEKPEKTLEQFEIGKLKQ